MMDVHQNEPVLTKLILKYFIPRRHQKRFCQANTFFLTFVTFAAYCISRRSIPIVKNALNKNCSELTSPAHVNLSSNGGDWCNWYPFVTGSADSLLSGIDYAFMSSYAIVIFFSGMIAERTNLRYFICIGMISCGVFTYLFGLAYFANIHCYPYFLIVAILDGAAQSTGWPGVVACVGSWFGRNRRGIIFAVWGSHQFIGAILGSYIAGYFLEMNWGMSFTVPAFIVGGVGVLLFLFLVPHPVDVGCTIDDYSIPQVYIPQFTSASEGRVSTRSAAGSFFFHHADDRGPPADSSTVGRRHSENSYSLEPQRNNNNERQNTVAISFSRALKIPGVLEYSMCLFFVNVIIKSFNFWVPRYLARLFQTDAQKAAYISIAFDVGGILGGITAGALMDISETNALTIIAYLALSMLSLVFYNYYGTKSDTSNITPQLLCGALLNGPAVLITTAVTAELGTHYTLEENVKALATVAGIINGIGAIGSSAGILFAGFAWEILWTNFYVFLSANLCALLCLLRIGYDEAKALHFRIHHW